MNLVLYDVNRVFAMILGHYSVQNVIADNMMNTSLLNYQKKLVYISTIRACIPFLIGVIDFHDIGKIYH